MTERDSIYRDPRNQLVDFAFDTSVAAVFPDMIRRSVPAYETVVPLTGLLAARHLDGVRHRRAAGFRSGDGGLVFDLGCSLGATTLALLRRLGNRPARIVAVDSSKPMLDRAAGLIDDDRVEFRLQDLRDTDVTGADAILMNYVLQFLPPGDRAGLMRRFREQMAPDGLLLLSEKIEFAAAGDQAYFDDAHLAFKKANGYSDLEVSGKRSALEDVMIVDTEETHTERLRAAGFGTVRTWFRCLNWASFLAWA